MKRNRQGLVVAIDPSDAFAEHYSQDVLPGDVIEDVSMRQWPECGWYGRFVNTRNGRRSSAYSFYIIWEDGLE